jgi:BlaI family transcriptional regulator, penicillinase repressor
MKPKHISELEQMVMDYVWAHAPATAEACREGLAARHPLKDSTIRTLLRRLEAKGYLRHEVDGRTYLYRPVERQQTVAARAVQQIIDKFCGGSVEQLLVGMVDHRVLDPGELKHISEKIRIQKIASKKGRTR